MELPKNTIRLEKGFVIKKFDPVSEHPLTTVVRDYLKGVGIDSGNVESETENSIVWRLQYEEDTSVVLNLYEYEKESFFFAIHCAIAIIDPKKESEILKFIATVPNGCPFPFRLITDDNLICVEFRTPCKNLDPEYLKTILVETVSYCEYCLTRLQQEFGLKSYFKGRENKK